MKHNWKLKTHRVCNRHLVLDSTGRYVSTRYHSAMKPSKHASISNIPFATTDPTLAREVRVLYKLKGHPTLLPSMDLYSDWSKSWRSGLQKERTRMELRTEIDGCCRSDVTICYRISSPSPIVGLVASI